MSAGGVEAAPAAGLGEEGKLLERILEAGSFFGRLGLDDVVVEVSAVKRQYRLLALAVHPDKCSHGSATDAFQKLSEAFDTLSTEVGQRKYLAEHFGQQGWRKAANRAAARKANCNEGRWWNTKTWEEFERRFRHREKAEAALHAEFMSGVKARRAALRVRAQVLAGERTAEHCDRTAGFPESELWPPQSRLVAGAAEQALAEVRLDDAAPQDFNERPELDVPQVAVTRLLCLLTHLRTVHRYCLYCGCIFDSFEDLERNCPGFTEEEHENAPNMAQRSSTETVIEAPDQMEAFEEDPLDVFMAGMEEQYAQDMKSRKRKPAGAEKGWTFQQQHQQNKNEAKARRQRR